MGKEAVADALERIVRGGVGITNIALAEAGFELTLPQWRVLVIVGEPDEGATVSEIAARTRAAVSPTSKLVTRLVRRGLLATSKDVEDRRVTRVRLTGPGRELRDGVLKRRRQLIGQCAAAAGPAAEDVVTFLSRLADEFGTFV